MWPLPRDRARLPLASLEAALRGSSERFPSLATVYPNLKHYTVHVVGGQLMSIK